MNMLSINKGLCEMKLFDVIYKMIFMKMYNEKDFIKPRSFRHSLKNSSSRIRRLGQVEKKID